MYDGPTTGTAIPAIPAIVDMVSKFVKQIPVAAATTTSASLMIFFVAVAGCLEAIGSSS
jgi:hypothetical protein